LEEFDLLRALMSTASFALTNQSNIDVKKGSGLAEP
jgi:hypothetical protein